MRKGDAPRTTVEIADSIHAYVNDASRGGAEIGVMIERLSRVGEVAIFGGMPRDIARGGADCFKSDVDLVVDCDPMDLDRAVVGMGSKRNKYGGHRLKLGMHDFDVWALPSTWAVREGHASAAALSDLVHTTFFDCDAVVYLCAQRAVQVGDGFARWLRDGVVGINLEVNPNPAGMLERANRIVDDWKGSLSCSLWRYMRSQAAHHAFVGPDISGGHRECCEARNLSGKGSRRIVLSRPAKVVDGCVGG